MIAPNVSEHIIILRGRVTDHRIGLTLHKLESIVNGDMDELLDALITAKQSELLRQVK